MLKPNTSPKSPRIELSNNTFAERKCCQVFAYESETCHRRRPNGISHCENGEQKPPKCALPVVLRWPPFNTAVPRPIASTTPNRSSDGWGTVAHRPCKVPIGYNGAPQIRPQKYPFPWTDCQTPIPAWSLDPPDLWVADQTKLFGVSSGLYQFFGLISSLWSNSCLICNKLRWKACHVKNLCKIWCET